MPNWSKTLAELRNNAQGPHDRLRQKYLKKLKAHTGRNVLVYYSGWLQKGRMPGVDFAIGDADKTGLMSCSHGVDRTNGLDLILHTPGGDVAATESIIDYLHSLYDGNIRAVVPQLAMSGGTLMALSCREIIMGRQSSLGPVDPQIGAWAAQGVVEEFKRAIKETTENPASTAMWAQIVQKYWPTLITNCEHAINWSDELLRGYLAKCMFADLPEAERNAKLEAVSDLLGKQATSKNHARHINPTKAKAAGLKIVDLEDDQKLQDIVLTLHHALTISFSETMAVKFIENDLGSTYATVAVPQ